MSLYAKDHFSLEQLNISRLFSLVYSVSYFPLKGRSSPARRLADSQITYVKLFEGTQKNVYRDRFTLTEVALMGKIQVSFQESSLAPFQSIRVLYLKKQMVYLLDLVVALIDLFLRGKRAWFF